jgi:dipeptidyl-peptidase 4
MMSRQAKGEAMPRNRIAPLFIFGLTCGSFLFSCASTKETQAPAVTKDESHESHLPVDHGLTLERIYAEPALAGKKPIGVSFSPDGKWLAFLKGSETDSEVLDLWALPLGQQNPIPILLIATENLVSADRIELSEEERMALERKRVRHRGITSYDWCGKSGDALLFPLSGNLYYVGIQELNAGGKAQVKKLTDKSAARLDARCSPKGSYVSFIESGDIYAIDVEHRTNLRLTHGASQTRTHGLAEFVAQEEMGRYDGHYWSPDEKYLAYFSVDEEKVSEKLRPRIYADRTEMYAQRYPAAGEDNATVAVHVLEVAKGNDRVLNTPSEDGYFPRMQWRDESKLIVQWQSRDQKQLKMLSGTAPEFSLQTLLIEEDQAWVSLHDDLRFLKDGRFIWASERSGLRHLYMCASDGSSCEPLTIGLDPVTRLLGVDEENRTLLYEKATVQSRERQVFSLKWSEAGAPGSKETQLTKEAGWHQATASPDGRTFIDHYSQIFSPAQVRVCDQTGQTIFVLEENKADEWNSFPHPEPIFGSIQTPSGESLNTLLLAPLNRENNATYPVITYVYGGPTAQTVVNRYHRLQPFFTWLTAQGYGVFLLDNRGSGHRDRAFTRSIYHRFGDIEVEDHLLGAAHLKTIPWVDANRIGVFGWSYGGYLSALLIMEDKTPYAAAASVAPVTDWTLYDTHYTERYIGKPQDEPALYTKGAVVPKATSLKRPFLLMHGMADDNVLFENSLALIQAFQEESIPFDLMVYPGRAHGLRGQGTQLHVFRSIANFFDRNLKPDTP